MILDVSELRIGNYITVADKVQKVNALSIDNDLCMIDTEEYHCYIGEPYNTPEPITLTHEIIEALGFKFNESLENYELNKVQIHDSLVHEGFLLDQAFDKKLEVEIQNVHELQNLFFALTGEELKVKEDSFLELLCR